mmetsp:Transcript_134448/g.287642  ORF Transcript_134448/g.287642 Transcript_134448/m.287642 type:complete len:214 (+) Transcript_134448:722-1363(+)
MEAEDAAGNDYRQHEECGPDVRSCQWASRLAGPHFGECRIVARLDDSFTRGMPPVAARLIYLGGIGFGQSHLLLRLLLLVLPVGLSCDHDRHEHEDRAQHQEDDVIGQDPVQRDAEVGAYQRRGHHDATNVEVDQRGRLLILCRHDLPQVQHQRRDGAEEDHSLREWHRISDAQLSCNHHHRHIDATSPYAPGRAEHTRCKEDEAASVGLSLP